MPKTTQKKFKKQVNPISAYFSNEKTNSVKKSIADVYLQDINAKIGAGEWFDECVIMFLGLIYLFVD